MKSFAFIVSAVVLGVSMILGLGAHGWLQANSRSNDVITVTGSTKKVVTADLAKWSANYTVQASRENLKEKLNQVDTDQKKISDFIVRQGLAKENITFLPVQTDTIYEQLPGYGQSQNVIGYTIRLSLTVESTEVPKVELLAQNAKNLIDSGIVFDYPRTEYLYTKLADLRPELFAAATADAQQRAKAMAKGTGTNVGDLRSARTGVIQILPPNSLEISDYGAYDLSTKEKEITATVSVSFELK